MDELCPQIGVQCVERNIEPYDVLTADEAFMTGTPFCMLPVTSLNHQTINNGQVGPVFTKLINQWSRNVGCDIIQQIANWSNNDSRSSNGPSPYQFKNKSAVNK
jgi:branched-chain amino acid aminotransferase